MLHPQEHVFDSNGVCTFCHVAKHNVMKDICNSRSFIKGGQVPPFRLPESPSPLYKGSHVHQPSQEEQAAFDEELARNKAMKPDSAPLALTPTSRDILSKARDIQEQRARDYDQPGGERSMAATVQAFNVITRRESEHALTESEGWLLMQTLKDVRDRSTAAPHFDSLLDGVSYSALKAEARMREGIAARLKVSVVEKSSITSPMNFGGYPKDETAMPSQDMVSERLTAVNKTLGRDMTKDVVLWVGGAEKVFHIDSSKYAVVYKVGAMLLAAYEAGKTSEQY